MPFPVIIRVFEYLGKLCGTTCKFSEMHFTVHVAAKHSHLSGHSEQWWAAKNRTPKNARTAIKTNILDEQANKMLNEARKTNKLK